MTLKRKFSREGFTAVELLVAIIIGVMMISASYQLYSVGMSTSGDAQRRTKASNIAYDLIRQQQVSLTSGPCTASSMTPLITADFGLSNATANVAITCPYNEMQPDGITVLRVSSTRLITAKITYDNGKEVIRAIAYKP